LTSGLSWTQLARVAGFCITVAVLRGSRVAWRWRRRRRKRRRGKKGWTKMWRKTTNF
jgi:hypothetical protein